MDSSCKKNYSIHEFDAKNLFDTYYSAHTPFSIIKESTIHVFKIFYKAFRTGMVTGRTVIDCSIGPIIHHLLAMNHFVQKITVLKVNDGSLKELEKWKNKDPDAFNWTHVTEFLEELKGNSMANHRHLYSEPEQHLCEDHAEYRRNLRKMCNVIKPGGYLILYAATNCSYFKIGEDKYHFLSCDERFYRKVISEEGFETKHIEKIGRRMSTDAVDHEDGIFIIAHKVT